MWIKSEVLLRVIKRVTLFMIIVYIAIPHIHTLYYNY